MYRCVQVCEVGVYRCVRCVCTGVYRCVRWACTGVCSGRGGRVPAAPDYEGGH